MRVLIVVLEKSEEEVIFDRVNSSVVLETASIENKQVEPDAFGVPLHRFDFENDWKCVAHVDRLDVEIF